MLCVRGAGTRSLPWERAMSAKVLLVSMAGYPMVPSCFVPDNGLAQLAACLQSEGHDVLVIDYNTPELMDRLTSAPTRAALRELIDLRCGGAWGEKEIERALGIESFVQEERHREYGRMGDDLAALIEREKPDWVGFKLWNGDGYTGSLEMAVAVKRRHPELPIVGGGCHVDFFSDYLFRGESPFDFLSVGEGEATVTKFSEFVQGNVAVDDVPNLLFRSNGEVIRTVTERVEDLSALPLGQYDSAVYPAMAGNGKIRVGVYEETRGCPYHCAFCNHPLKTGHKMRSRTVEGAVSDIVALKREYGLAAFKLGGSYTPSAYLRELANELIRVEANIEFCGYGRINDAQPDDFGLYYEAGCRALFFGVETGSQLLLDTVIDKRYQTSTCASTLTACREAGITTVASLVYPNPGETAESREATMSLLRDAAPDCVPVHFPMLLPGSAWWDDPGKFGIDVPDRDAYLATAIGYKARLLFPPRFWPPLPYTINGMAFGEFAEETAVMTEEIDALGCVTLLSDESSMIGRHSGLDLRAFRDRSRDMFLSGDASGMQAMVEKVNGSLAAM